MPPFPTPTIDKEGEEGGQSKKRKDEGDAKAAKASKGQEEMCKDTSPSPLFQPSRLIKKVSIFSSAGGRNSGLGPRKEEEEEEERIKGRLVFSQLGRRKGGRERKSRPAATVDRDREKKENLQ